MLGTRRQPVRAQGGCQPVASGERAHQPYSHREPSPANSLGDGGVGPRAREPLDGSQALAHTVTGA